MEFSSEPIEYVDMFALHSQGRGDIRLSEELFKWEHYENPSGESLFVSAWEDGRLVGTEVLQYLDLQIGDENLTSAISLESFIDPTQRGKGLWTRLVLHSQQLASERGIDVIWGFPNAASTPILEKHLNWTYHSSVHSLIRFIRPNPADKALLKYGARVLSGQKRMSTGEPFQRVEPDEASYVELIDSTPATDHIRIKKDWRYISWRYMEYPQKNKIINIHRQGNSIDGFESSVVSKNVKHVLEVRGAYEDYDRVLESIIEDSLEKKHYNIQLVTLKNTPLWRSAKRLGFHAKSRHQVWVNHISQQSREILSDRSWDLQMGDEDITFCRLFE